MTPVLLKGDECVIKTINKLIFLLQGFSLSSRTRDILAREVKNWSFEAGSESNFERTTANLSTKNFPPVSFPLAEH